MATDSIFEHQEELVYRAWCARHLTVRRREDSGWIEQAIETAKRDHKGRKETPETSSEG